MTHTQKNPKNICENCGFSQFETLFSGSDKLLGIPGHFDVIECQNCGLYQISPKLNSSEIEKYYPADYICYLEAIEDDHNAFSRLNRRVALDKRCKQVTKRARQPGRILDIGCATGIFLDGMQNRGWDPYGIEPNQQAADYAKKRFKIEVFNGYLEEANLSDSSFDVITLWDVLEHVQNPNVFFEEILRILKPGGIVIGTLPNATAWERYLFGEYWVGWEIPRHYRSHTPTTIRNFLKQHGFLNIELFSFIGRHGAFLLSVQFWLNSWQASERIKTIIQVILGSLVLRVLTYPYFILAEKFNRSNVMTFSAYKPISTEE